MDKILKALKSKTFWTAVVLFAIAGFEGVRELIPANLVVPVEACLTFLIGYFKVTPSQKY